jgi:hypothetical protein
MATTAMATSIATATARPTTADATAATTTLTTSSFYSLRKRHTDCPASFANCRL